MTDQRNHGDLQGVYSALLGGLMAALVASVVIAAVVDPSGGSPEIVPIVAALIGMGAAILFMVAGMLASDRVPWLGGSLLFASGFTTLWTLVISFAAEPRWAIPAVLAIAIAVGLTLGRRRFGTGARADTIDSEGVAWTR
jgi:hypothetical protein